MTARIAVVGAGARARSLACELDLPLYASLRHARGQELALLWRDDEPFLKIMGDDAPGPVRVDWSAPDIKRRVAGGRKQPLARAVGLHRHHRLHVVDATAGLGRDGLVLAALGAQVTLCERSRVLVYLLREARARAVRDPSMGAWVSQRVGVYAGDARDYLRVAEAAPDVVYLDPMYPLRAKQALAKKEMRLLRLLVGDDADAGALLQTARAAARRRVVVKRAAKAPDLAGQAPHLRYTGKQARYDVYLAA